MQKTSISTGQKLSKTSSQVQPQKHKQNPPKASANTNRLIPKSTLSNNAKQHSTSNGGVRTKPAVDAPIFHNTDEEEDAHDAATLLSPRTLIQTEERSRSRTGSSSTLLARSQPQSQHSQNQGQDSAVRHQGQDAAVRPGQQAQPGQLREQTHLSRKVSQKSEETTFAELLVLTRRYYLAFLSNVLVEDPV